MLDWRADLSTEWRTLLGDVEPDLAGVPGSLTFDPEHPVLPGRLMHALNGARADAHLFRAFDALEPCDVRCVLLGQDPYPKVMQATGRSFEQGDVSDWSSRRIASSLTALVSRLAEHRTGEGNFTTRGGFRRALASPLAAIEPPMELFDRWQDAGVLCLNTALTLTRYRRGGTPEQIKGHLPFWSPVIRRLLHRLADGDSGHVVLLLLGRHACHIADLTGIRRHAERAGTWGNRIEEVRLPHPSARIAGQNPFTAVDDALDRMGRPAIGW